MEEIKAAWSGKAKLWKVFWLYNFLLGSALIYAMDYAALLGLVVEIIAYIIVLIWGIWVLVALWRCAFNAGWRGWGYIARGIVVLTIGWALLTIVGAFVGMDLEPA